MSSIIDVMLGVKSILFDMDGVIVDSMESHARSWKLALAEYGIIVDDIDIYKREGMSGFASVQNIFNEKGFPSLKQDDFNNLLNRKNTIFEKNVIKIFPYVEELINLLKSKNIALALVTGSLKRTVDMLSKKIVSYFDVIITAEDVEKGKPDPEPYLKALKELNCDPRMSIVIENAPMGILSAKNAGIDCYAIETTLSHEYLYNADKVFKNHKMLLQFFENNIISNFN